MLTRHHPALRALALALPLLGGLMLASPPMAHAEQLVIQRRVTIIHIPATPAPMPGDKLVPVPKQTASNRCLPLNQIYGAVVENERRVTLSLKGPRYYSLELADSCPALAYYEGFYFQPHRPGLICAGRDTLIDRTGKPCAIRKIKQLKRRP